MSAMSAKYPLGKHTGDSYTCPVTGLKRLKVDLYDDLQH